MKHHVICVVILSPQLMSFQIELFDSQILRDIHMIRQDTKLCTVRKQNTCTLNNMKVKSISPRPPICIHLNELNVIISLNVPISYLFYAPIAIIRKLSAEKMPQSMCSGVYSTFMHL